MDLALLVYGISILHSIQPVLGITIGFTILSLIITVMYRLIGLNIESWDSESTKKRKLEDRVAPDKWIKRFFCILAGAVLLSVVIPNERTAYMMVGAYATQKVAENDKVQETGKKVLTLIEQKLDSYIDEGAKELERKVEGNKRGKSKD